MHFQLTEQQRELQDSARNFAQKELPELAREMEAKDFSVPAEMVRRYGGMGFLGVNLPEQYGGLGLGHFEAILVLEQFAMISNAVAFPVFEALVGPVRTLERFGSEELKQRIIPQVTAGEATVAVSMSEPDAGTALTELTTHASDQGDHYLLNGTKRWTSGAGHARYYVTYCRLSDEPAAKGIGALLVDKDMEGVSFGAREELMGFRGIETRDIIFDNVKVPKANLVIGAGGFGQLMQAFGLERCGNATQSLGLAQAALDQAIAYTQERKAFDGHLYDLGAIRQRMAMNQAKLDAVRAAMYHAAWLGDDVMGAGRDNVKEMSGVKAFGAETIMQIMYDCMQFHGGMGYMRETPVERMYRDARILSIGGGATEVMLEEVAKRSYQV